MLIISQSQMEVLGEASRRRFEDRMVEHLGGFSPPLCKAVGEDSLRKTIRLGITRAASHGFNLQGPVRLYLELMLLFGSHFDTDPQYPWAAQVLLDQDSDPQMKRAERLYERTLDHQAKTVGPGEGATSGLLRDIGLLSKTPRSLSTERSLIPDMLREITQAHPRRAAHVGVEGLEALIRQGMGAARRLRLPSVRGTGLVIVLMLLFGHGCFEDPLYPWIAQTLKNPTFVEPESCARDLEAKALAWLEQMLNHLAEGAPS